MDDSIHSLWHSSEWRLSSVLSEANRTLECSWIRGCFDIADEERTAVGQLAADDALNVLGKCLWLFDGAIVFRHGVAEAGLVHHVMWKQIKIISP